MTTIVAFSHLRWDFVYQRPQHLLTRLAKRWPVVFVEEPVRTAGAPWLERRAAADGITVLRAHSPVDVPGFHDDQLAVLRPLLAPVLETLDAPIAWLYTPMALPLLPLLRDLDAATLVYDCMDELTAFRQAPKQLAQREHALLQRADLVFTGGPSLYRAKKDLHPSVHCFPSSVDAAHFARGVASVARDDATAPTARQDAIARPRLGYCGVIDERVDASLIDALALAHPSWQIVMIGPVVKIDPMSLPRHPNIHYLGMQAYQDLPAFLAGWDVCLMPFAANESTRFISPTKVLEYMAAGKPIVSTPIRDVAEPYADVVAIAGDATAFIDACGLALAESSAAADARRAAMRARVATTSWDRTADAMAALIDASIASRRARMKSSDGDRDVDMKTGFDATPRDAGLRAAPAAPIPTSTSLRSIPCAVIGAGPTGLSAAYHLPEAIVFERESTIGGWCRSIEDNGFTFDYAGHIMFSNDPIVHDLYKTLLGDNVHWQNREAWIYSHGVHTRYPFQQSLYGLPADVLKECIVGAIEARFGSIDARKPAAARPVEHDPDPKAALSCTTAREVRPSSNDDCCGDGEHVRPANDAVGSDAASPAAADLATAPPAAVVLPLSTTPRNFEEFIHRVWGAGVARHFAIPYNRKLWTVPLAEMETSWLGGRVPLPDLGEMIEGALQPSAKPVGPNARFGYPLRGGFQALMDGFKPFLGDRVECDADVTGLDVKRHRLTLADGRSYAYETLISTMPLPRLVALIGDAAPASVHQAAAGLRHISVRCVNLGVARENVTDKHWIYYPEDTVFHRIFVQGNTSPHCNPPGGFGITCEISHSPTKPLPCDGEALIRRCFDDCVRVGLLRADDRLIAANQADMEYAYVLYDHARAANVETIRNWLALHDVILAGRYSEWEYYNSDHAFLAGRRAALEIEGRAQGRASGAA